MIKNTRLGRVAQRVLNKNGTRWGIEVTFVTPAGNVKGRRVIEFFSSSDYLTKFTTDYELITLVSLVDYRYKLYPYRDNLITWVRFYPLDVSSNQYLSSSPLYATAYRGLLFDNDDGSTTASSPLTQGTESIALDEERMIKLQLVEQAAEILSYKSAQGTFRVTDNYNIVTGFLAEMVRQEAERNPAANVAIQMTPIDDVVEKREAVTIPPTIRLIDVPEYMQTRQGGLYSTGVGSFIRHGTWWIYPLFDTTRYQKTTRRLNIIQLQGYAVPLAERSWVSEHNEVTVVCTGACKMQDTSVCAGINKGQGTRFLKASALFDTPTTGGGNKDVYNQERVLAEFQVGERQDGNRIAMFSDTPITDNVANEYSKIALRQGQMFITLWQRSFAQLLYPGMPLRLFYDKDGQTEVYDGVLLQVDEQWSSESGGLIEKSMISSASLTCFINKEPTKNG